jgi:hypothetical protein
MRQAALPAIGIPKAQDAIIRIKYQLTCEDIMKQTMPSDSLPQ